MSTPLFKDILAVVSKKAPDKARDRALSNSLAISRWLGANLHILEVGAEPAQDILEAVRRDHIDLLLLALRFLPDERAAKRWQVLLQEIPDTPVLICSTQLDLLRHPVQSLLVPMSGEPHISAALDVALSLANAFSLPVDLLHVTDIDAPDQPPSPVARATEHPSHEYSKVIDQLIAQSTPYAQLRERLVIRGFQHVEGDIASEICNCVEKKQSCLLVLEWKGSLATGRARTIKSAMARYSFPILLVRERPGQRSVLKVGSQFEAA